VADQKRLFVGVKVSMATVSELAAATETLARRAQLAGLRVRWVAPASHHVTLKFLGWTRPDTVTALADALGKAVAGVPPFSFRTQRLGGFPSLDKASVLWAGIEDRSGSLTRLAEAIDREVAELGFEPERRRFHAHVTLGRLREPSNVSEVVLPLAEQVFSETRASEVFLFESEMKSNGSEYRSLLKIALETPAEAAKRQTATVQRPSFDASNTADGPRSSDGSSGSDAGSGTDDGWG
jgi:RNA 2',3'-cyclic 3'-phosphodiesterase